MRQTPLPPVFTIHSKFMAGFLISAQTDGLAGVGAAGVRGPGSTRTAGQGKPEPQSRRAAERGAWSVPQAAIAASALHRASRWLTTGLFELPLFTGETKAIITAVKYLSL